MNDLLTGLLQQLDAPAAQLDRLDRYYHGQQPLAFLSPGPAQPSETASTDSR